MGRGVGVCEIKVDLWGSIIDGCFDYRTEVGQGLMLGDNLAGIVNFS